MALQLSSHFNLEKISDGVYAAIHADGGMAQSNAGIIDLGDHTLVYDTFISPQAARDLRSAVEKLFGRPVTTVINSHYHNDHIWGNQAFPDDTPIISTAITRSLIEKEGIEEFAWFKENSQSRLDALEKELELQVDTRARQHTGYAITYYKTILATLPDLEIRMPSIVFSEQMDFFGTQRSAQLIDYGGGHSGSDASLFLPEDGILFLSDLLFIGVHTFLPDGDPDTLRQTLEKLKALNASVLVPGHGRTGNNEDIDQMIRYMDTLESIVQDAIRNGFNPDQFGQVSIPVEYRDWILPVFFPANLKFLYNHRTKK